MVRRLQATRSNRVTCICRLKTGFLLALLAIVCCYGCASVRTEKVLVFDYIAERIDINYLKDYQQVPDPEQARYEVDQHFYCNDRQRFLEALRAGNYLLATWPGDRYAPQIANRCAWAALFALQPVATYTDDSFSLWEENTMLLARAIFYAGESMRLEEPKEYWAKRAIDIRFLALHGGYTNPSRLFEFLEARKMMMIDAVNEEDVSYYKEARRLFENIKREAPYWIPDFVDKMIGECSERLDEYEKIKELMRPD